MSQHPDDPHRDGVDHPDQDQPGPGDEAALDEDAAWREIVENYGDRPAMGPPEPTPAPPRAVFDRTFVDGLNTEATWEDEGHFVPPDPPPLPRMDPRRKVAWAGLFGPPLMLLLAVVFGWVFPTWGVVVLVGAFVGGFLYLVSTMPRSRHDDWPGDDGAVV
jgi:hypothetical protein